MSRDIQPFPVRIPHDLREHLESAAKKASRSLNSEIVLRLADSFAAEGVQMLTGLPDRIDAQIAELDQMFERLEGKVSRVKSLVMKSETGAGKAGPGREKHAPAREKRKR